MRDNVARVRRLLEEAAEARRPDPTPEAKALQNFSLHEFNRVQQHTAEQTPRARAQREIERIANWYGWGGEIDRALDAAGVMSAGGMTDAQIEQLLTRMRQLEDCVQNGTDCPDAPPAR